MGAPERAARPVFADLATAFCRWCEDEEAGQATDERTARWLARLHAAALALPESEPTNDDGPPELPAAEFARAKARLARFAGRYYRYLFDPDVLLDEEPVVGALADDVLDVYRVIKCGARLHARGEQADALWQWRFSHRHHWGAHALAAAYVLHAEATRSS